MQIVRDGCLAHHNTAPPKGCAMTDEKKKDKKEKKDDNDAKKVDDEQLKDVAGGVELHSFDCIDRPSSATDGEDTQLSANEVAK